MPAKLSHRLLFIRHGETSWNREGRLQGQQDIPLNPRGVDQSLSAGRDLRKRLISQGYEDATFSNLDFIASPLGRTRHTMELVRQGMKLPPTPYEQDARLMELSFGAWEGLTWPQVKKQAPEAALAREQGKWSFTPPGGESYATLAERVTPWLETLSRETLVVSHGGVARALMVILADLDHDRAASVDIWQGRVLVFEHGAFSWL